MVLATVRLLAPSTSPSFHTSLSVHSQLIVLDWIIQRLLFFSLLEGKKSATCHIVFVFFRELGLKLVGSVLAGLTRSWKREGSCFIHLCIFSVYKNAWSIVGAIS